MGCDECNGIGYRGRVPIEELMEMSDSLREAVDQYASSAELHKAARESGMRTMRDYGFELVRQGVTSLVEVNRITAANSG